MNLAAYDQQYLVPSASGGKDHKVSHYPDDSWACDCWPWRKSRQDCGHIEDARTGGGKQIYPTLIEGEPRKIPTIVPANVEQVTINGAEIYTPLIPIGDTWFQATLVYDLLRAGLPWSKIRERYDIAKRNSKVAIEDYIFAHGRRIYKFVQDGDRHWVDYQTTPWGAQLPYMIDDKPSW